MKSPAFLGAVTLVALLLLVIYGISAFQPSRDSSRVNGSETGIAAASFLPTADFGNPSLGPTDAPLTIFVYGDFQCSACATLDATLRKVAAEFPDKIRLVWKDLPNNMLHLQAKNAAVAARCAREQGSFWEYHDLLMAQQEGLTDETYAAAAGQVGLDAEVFSTCYRNRTTEPLVNRDIEEAIRLGVDATPYMFIGSERQSGALGEDRLRTMIQTALRNSAAATTK